MSKISKKQVAASILIVGGLTSPLAHATNGDTMMSVGSQNTALGGTGIANFVGAESTFANPAMLGKSKGSEVVGGIVYFKPTVTNTGMAGSQATSGANPSYIPDISFSSRISDSLTYGVAVAGIAGMGVDYTGAPANSFVAARTALTIAKIVPTIAYNQANYGLGFSPVLQYGSLAISYNNGAANVNPSQSSSSSTGAGFTLGGYYNPMAALTLAAAYNSKIAMSYGQQLSTAGAGFGQTFGNNLDQPAEIKAGVAYNLSDAFLVTADYRKIQWSSAKGYKDFGWQDQNVVAVGGKYSADAYWLGLGYNHGNDPIGVFANGNPAHATDGQNGIGNMFNNLLFPAIITNSYTFGGGYSLTKELGLEASYMYAPKVTKTVDISDAARLAPGSLSNTTTHKQQALSVSLRYKF